MELMSILLLSLVGLLQMNDTTELAFVGDAMQHGAQIRAAAQVDGSYDYSPCFTLVEGDIRSADYAVANLECPLGGKPYSGYPLFSCPDDYAKHLSNIGFDMLVTANNHCLDCGDRGLKRTIKALDDMGIPHIGTYSDKDDRVRRLPCIINVNGVKIAFLSYTYGTNGFSATTPVVVDFINKKRIEADLDSAYKAGAGMVCVYMHWGNEYEMLPSRYQRELAEFLANKGADMIIGSHPHVVQPFELRCDEQDAKNVFVAYSLGNFISNQNDATSRGGAMAKVTIARYENDPIVLDASYKLFFCQKPAGKGDNYLLIPQGMQELVRNDSKNAFNAFMDKTLKVLVKNNKNIINN